MTSSASPIITTRRAGWVVEPLPFDTVPKMFWQRVQQLGPAIMMRQKDLGIWKAYSWTETGNTVAQQALAALPVVFQTWTPAGLGEATENHYAFCLRRLGVPTSAAGKS